MSMYRSLTNWPALPNMHSGCNTGGSTESEVLSGYCSQELASDELHASAKVENHFQDHADEIKAICAVLQEQC